MPDAFLDAERTAAALDDVFAGRIFFDDSMRAAHETRDAHAVPIYEFTTTLATLASPPPEQIELLAAAYGNQPATDGFVSLTTGPCRRPTTSPTPTSLRSWQGSD